MQAFIEALPLAPDEGPPLLVGHSFGGLFVQMLLDRRVGRAGIALNPALIGGVPPGWWTLTAALPPILRWNGWNRPYAFTRERWARRFANAAPWEQQDRSYDSYVIPTSGRVFHQAAFWVGTRIKPSRRTQPLLITAGDRERMVTPYLSRAALWLQSRSAARTDFKLFPGRSHLLIAEPGWEEVAAYSSHGTPIRTCDRTTSTDNVGRSPSRSRSLYRPPNRKRPRPVVSGQRMRKPP